MKPKVVILSAFLTPFRSGAEACAEEVPLQLADQFDLTIITARLRRDLPKEDMLQGKIRVRRVGVGIFWLDKWIWYPIGAPFVALLMRPDIVHGILETFAGFALLLCKIFSKIFFLKTKTILTLQTTNRSFLKSMIVRSPDKVTAISKYLAGIAENLGRKDVGVIPNGINVSAFENARQNNQKVIGRILFVGRLEQMKGVDLLLRAFAQCNYPSATLRVVGDGSQRNILQNLAKSLSISDRVQFVGRMSPDHIYREYAQADVFCALSRSEAQGNVFLEAQAGGCVILATAVGGIPEFTPPKEHVGGVAWYVVPNPPIDLVVYALHDCLTNEPLRAHHRSASITNSAQYDWKLIANQYAQIYKSFTLDKS